MVLIQLKLELSRAQNPQAARCMAFVARTSWHMNDNYIDLSAHMHASQAQVEGCRTSLEVEYKGLISSLV